MLTNTTRLGQKKGGGITRGGASGILDCYIRSVSRPRPECRGRANKGGVNEGYANA